MPPKARVWRPPQVRVVWVDACQRPELNGTLGAVLDRAKLVKRETVGYLLKYDDYLTVLAADYDAPEAEGEEAEIGNITVIPSGWVLAVMKGRRKVEKNPPAPAAFPAPLKSEPTSALPSSGE